MSLFVQNESLQAEGKQSSNSANMIMVRSESRSHHSPWFKNTESSHPSHMTAEWNPKSKEQGSQCVLIESKRSRLECDV